MNKNAIVILYEGDSAELEDCRKMVEALAKRIRMNTTTVAVRVLSEDEIIKAAVAVTTQQSLEVSPKEEANSPEDHAAIYIGERFKEHLSPNVSRFSPTLSIAYVTARLSQNDVQLTDAVEILSKDDAWWNISEWVRIKYNINVGVMKIIKTIHDSVCVGHIGL